MQRPILDSTIRGLATLSGALTGCTISTCVRVRFGQSQCLPIGPSIASCHGFRLEDLFLANPD